jgi:hypothetical protein
LEERAILAKSRYSRLTQHALIDPAKEMSGRKPIITVIQAMHSREFQGAPAWHFIERRRSRGFADIDWLHQIPQRE